MAGVWILTVIVFTSACWIQVIIGSCSRGTFGDSCSYTCHCGRSCNQTTGVCGGVCDRGWVGGNGGTCQKENVALGKDASSPTALWSSVWTADKAVDGNSNQDVYRHSCFNSEDNVMSSWTVDLGDDYRIHDVRIYHQKLHLARIRTAALYLSNTSNTTSVPCYTFPSNTSVIGNGIYDIVCDGIGRYFTITDPTHLNLCEVEIYVCSPGVFGVSCNQFCHCLQAACDPVSGVCPGDCRPGWQGDRCDTECDADYYGVNCLNICTNRKCSDVSSSCDRYNGSCDKGCLPGWRGVDCTQECYNGTYGADCNMTCSERKCAGDSSCDHVRGTCTSGCVSGWKGGDCTTACDSQHYGANCDKTCASRHCVGKSSCNSTGHCDKGCETGWTLDDCTASLPQQNNPVGGEEILIPAVTVTTIVVLVVAGAAVGVVILRRRRRLSPQESDSHDYYNTSHLSKVPTKQSRDNDETQLEARTYDGLSVMSREIQGPEETYCTLNTEKPYLEGEESGEVAETTDRDIYMPTEPRTYETLDSTSRDMTGEYSELGKIA
ncbi:multiple epidermal growth factor-like domains protein 10 [Haliotis rufescens]|uniref:multiple epidermal growth factor-like domains protein 10 n=1 Tax=Haliotis rufescens TaxID=6454 RepID=UPI00201F189F|nr:multiple epidermal growth factor-like domains protein 10 [Haliotis rufescens]